MSNMSNNSSKNFIGGLMLGATIGAFTGLLMAPRTGRETRKLLKKSASALPDLAEDLSTSAQIQADRLSENAIRSWDETLERLREAVLAGIDASAREHQALNREKTKTQDNSNSLPQHINN